MSYCKVKFHVFLFHRDNKNTWCEYEYKSIFIEREYLRFDNVQSMLLKMKRERKWLHFSIKLWIQVKCLAYVEVACNFAIFQFREMDRSHRKSDEIRLFTWINDSSVIRYKEENFNFMVKRHAPCYIRMWQNTARRNAKRELNELFIMQFQWHNFCLLALLQHVFCIFNWNPLNLCWEVCVCAFFRVSVISAHKLPEYGNEIGAKRARLTIKNEEKTHHFGCSLSYHAAKLCTQGYSVAALFFPVDNIPRPLEWILFVAFVESF